MRDCLIFARLRYRHELIYAELFLGSCASKNILSIFLAITFCNTHEIVFIFLLSRSIYSRLSQIISSTVQFCYAAQFQDEQNGLPVPNLWLESRQNRKKTSKSRRRLPTPKFNQTVDLENSEPLNGFTIPSDITNSERFSQRRVSNTGSL